jgi:site-specific DNA-methyltransferase (adenine-specific)
MIEDLINKIICADCLDVLKTMPDKSIKLSITSPPYNIGIDYDQYEDIVDWEAFINWNEECLKELRRVSEQVVWVIGSHNNCEFLTNLRPILESMKPYKVIYCPRYLYMNPVEFAIHFWPENFSWEGKHKPPLLLNGQTPHWLPVVFGKVENLYEGHPATFPERIPTFFIESFTEKGDIVMDCCNGTGSTCVVAKKMNRKYIGIDLSRNYCDIAIQRLKEFDTGVPVKEARAGQIPLFKV